MNPKPDRDESLERFVDRALRELPPRHAPGSLEARVLAEIARRSALPWWHKSFTHWPLPARAAFLVALAGVVKVVLFGAVWIMAGFDGAQFRDAFATPFNWFESGIAVARAMTDCCEIIGRNIPPLWLYGGLAFIGTMYFALFGLGAAAYRTLYARR